MARHRVLILGTGLISRFHQQAIETSDRLELAGRIPFRTGDWRAALARADADFLVVATASGAHDEAVLAAAERRLPVLVEKPLAISTVRLDALAAACAATGTPLGCICQTRWTPAFQATLSAVRAGRLGRLTYARVAVPWWRDDAYYTESAWHGTRALDGGGALMNQSIHMIDWLTALMPPVAEVRGFTATLAHPMETEDTACAAIRFEGGALGAVYGSTSSWPGRAKTLEVTGTKGTIVLRDHAIAEWTLADGTPPPRLETAQTAAHGSSRPDQLDSSLHRACFEAFAAALDGGDPYPVDAAAARRSIDLIERIYARENALGRDALVASAHPPAAPSAGPRKLF